MNKKILLNIELTSHCFANCSMCPRHEVTDFGYLSEQSMDEIISKIDTNLFWEINLSGRGEPTLHPQFPILAKKLGSVSVPKALVTTGVKMTPPILEAIQTSIDKVRLSISSYDIETFSQVHRGLHFSTIWKNIELIAASFPEKVVCHLVGGPSIYKTLPKTIAHLRSLGFSELYLFPLWNRAGSQESVASKEERIKLLDQLQIPPSEKEYANKDTSAFIADAAHFSSIFPDYCPVGDSSIAIGYNGDIIGCFQDFGHKTTVGNIHTHSLTDVYTMRKKLLGNMEICKLCNTKKDALTCIKKG